MAIDLDGPRAIVEELIMLDRCTIEKPVAARDRVFNEVTGDYEPQDATVIVTDQPCKIREGGGGTGTTEAGPGISSARVMNEEIFQVSLPWDTPAVPIGSILTVTESQDATLQGRTLTVREVVQSTILVVRRLICIGMTSALDSR